MTKFKLMEINPLSRSQLRAAGYSPSKYYCGNDGWASFYTLVRDKLQALGIPFPLNEACFIHDIHYGEIWVGRPGFFKSIYYKIKSDFIFNENMRQLLDTYLKDKNCEIMRGHLQWRRRSYFTIVLTLGTVGYAGALLWRAFRNKND